MQNKCTNNNKKLYYTVNQNKYVNFEPRIQYLRIKIQLHLDKSMSIPFISFYFCHNIQIQLTRDNLNPLQLKPCVNLNQNQFPLDFRHTFTVILSSITQTLDNLNIPLTRSSFCFPSDHFYIILPSITRTMF